MERHWLLLLILCTGSCAAPGPGGSPSAAQGRAAGPACFSTNFIEGYETLGREAIRVRVGVNDRYDILFAGGRCDQLEWSQSLAIDTFATSQLCVGKQPGQGMLHFRDPLSHRRIACHIDEVRSAPPEPPKA